MARTYVSARVGPVGVTQGVGVPWGAAEVAAMLVLALVASVLFLLTVPVVLVVCCARMPASTSTGVKVTMWCLSGLVSLGCLAALAWLAAVWASVSA